MLAAMASAALIVGASLLIGQAVFVLCGRPRPNWLAGPVGLAILLALTATAASLGARGPALALLLTIVLVLTLLFHTFNDRNNGRLLALLRRKVGSRGSSLRPRSQDSQAPRREARPGLAPDESRGALVAALIAVLFAALPFIAAGAVGLLGVGLVNDDMASHLLITDWIDERFRPEPVFIDQGYPLGPHALVAGLANALSASSIDVFAGLTLALPMLTALVAFSALGGLGPRSRVVCAALVAVPYMAAAYLAQEAFKEPTMALFVLGFALWLPQVRRPLEAIPLGILAAGAVYAYSFPGLAWLLGTAVVYLAIAAFRARRQTAEGPGAEPLRDRARFALAGGALAALVLAILLIPELHRLADFRDFRALDPDRANEGGLGNLRGQLSPLTAFGIWPTSDFRLPAGAGSLPSIVFYLGGALGLFAFALALPRWIRRHGEALPAALLTAALLYIAARGFGTVYTSAKALSIIAPLVMLTTLGGLLARLPAPPALKRSEETGMPVQEPLRIRTTHRPRIHAAEALEGHPRLLTALAVMVALAAGLSSFLILRSAPVAPETHMKELAEIRPLVKDEKVLFLGRDNFILYELRGSRPFTAVKNYYDPLFVEPNEELANVFSKFDLDSVDAETLAEFPYVLTTRAAYASGPPPGYEVVKQTPTYVLWERGAPGAQGREPGESDVAPGANVACGDAEQQQHRGTSAVFAREPILLGADEWSQNTVENGPRAVISTRLPEGAWQLSLQYDSTRPLTISTPRDSSTEGPSFSFELPANLDYRGPGPYYPAGEIESDGGTVTLLAGVEAPPFAGQFLGASAVAHLGALAFTAVDRRGGYVGGGGERPYPGDSSSLVRGDKACGRYVDWFEAPAD